MWTDKIEKKLRGMKHLEELPKKMSASLRAISSLADDLKTLKSHVVHLGESTAIACKHLTQGMNDVQECSVDIADWAAKVQTYINEEFVGPESKRLCPEIQYTKFNIDEDVFNIRKH